MQNSFSRVSVALVLLLTVLATDLPRAVPHMFGSPVIGYTAPAKVFRWRL